MSELQDLEKLEVTWSSASLERGLADAEQGRVRPLPWVTGLAEHYDNTDTSADMEHGRWVNADREEIAKCCFYALAQRFPWELAHESHKLLHYRQADAVLAYLTSGETNVPTF